MAGITQLNIEKAVSDAIQRTESDPGKSISFGGTVNQESVSADVEAGLGDGWSLAAMYRRWRTGSRTREAAVRVRKDF